MSRRALYLALAALLLAGPLLVSAQIPKAGNIVYTTQGAAAVFPPLQSVTITITPAQIRTCFSAPVEVIPAPPSGYFLRIEQAYWLKEAGSLAFGIASVTNQGLQFSGGSIIAAFGPTNWLNVTTVESTVIGGPAPVGGAVSLFAGGRSLDNQSIRFFCAGANPTSGDMNTKYWITYRTWPLAAL